MLRSREGSHIFSYIFLQGARQRHLSCLRGAAPSSGSKCHNTILFQGPRDSVEIDVGVPGFKGKYLCDLQQKIRPWPMQVGAGENVQHTEKEDALFALGVERDLRRVE